MVRRRLIVSILRLSYNISALFIIFILVLYTRRYFIESEVFSCISSCGRNYLHYKETTDTVLNSTELKYIYNKYNEAERITNIDKYGSIRDDTIIFVVHVSTITQHLKYFLASLCEVKGIEDTLIVFSHKYYDKSLYDFIENIDFCRVLQIFYPFSLQIFQRDFPGFSSNDCPYYLDFQTAKSLNCTNAMYPDIHGRYRVPAAAENKHHWRWTANKVFQDLKCTEHYVGIVVFIEPSFLMVDFLYMILNMKKVAKTLPQCDFLSLGGYSSVVYNNMFRLDFMTWHPRYHSIAFAFDVSVWNSLVSHYDLYCLLDDSSWSRSLYYVSLNRRDGKRFKVLSSNQPRALYIPIKRNKWWYTSQFDDVLEVILLQKKFEKDFFPPFLEVYTDIELEDDEYFIFEVLEGEGGWSDPRDHSLCSNITINRVNKLLLDMKIEFGGPKINK